ncbi:PEP-CTERM sorting domain-containing protein [Nostoc sp. FACHB-892]|uniref:PEP-CTERM sorting domain-containing protein n=1 Tax=Nostoc sp. FACHB-892 TaxID=2692843 RepID=UPI00168A11F9|nr:PEP-CTERM sorting domain-containing protein [Nostoc sp. FACHB-892]MBD2726745.1 PEP-CTERM sorting domain-containing protein [Nostoc sp. FACHB-892]
MISLKSKVLNATLAATFAIPLATAGMFTSAGSVQAVTLNGSIGLSGTAVVPNDGDNPTNTKIEFLNVAGVTSFGDFAKFLPSLEPTDIKINTLKLTKLADVSATTATYNTDINIPFIDFGSQTLGTTTAALTFDLDNSVVTRIGIPNVGIIDATLQGITGKFNFNGQTIASGFFSTSLSGSASTYQLTLTTVPEPTTMLGLGLVGAGMIMSRRRKSVVQ